MSTITPQQLILLGWTLDEKCTLRALPFEIIRIIIEFAPNRLQRFYKLIKQFPDKEWDYEKISKNQFIDWNLVLKYPDKKWNYKELSKKLNIPKKILLDLHEKPWNWWHLLKYNSDAWDIVDLLSNKRFNWYNLGNLLGQDKQRWKVFCKRANCSDWRLLDVIKLNAPWDIIESYPDKKWNWIVLSRNPDFSTSLILKFKNKPLDWNCLSIRKDINMDFICSNSDLPWNWSLLFPKKVNIDFVIINPQKHWNWNKISSDPSITWKIIQKNNKLPWVWSSISKNPNITPKLYKIIFTKIGIGRFYLKHLVKTIKIDSIFF